MVRENSPISEYIHYRSLCYGMGNKLVSAADVVDLTEYVLDPYDWKDAEISAILMVMPEFNRESLEAAARFAKIAG